MCIGNNNKKFVRQLGLKDINERNLSLVKVLNELTKEDTKTDDMKKLLITNGKSLQDHALDWIHDCSQNKYWLLHASKGHFTANLEEEYTATYNVQPNASEKLLVKYCPICSAVNAHNETN